MSKLEFEMLRQILANQFTILKYIKCKVDPSQHTQVLPHNVEKRLKHTDELLKEAFSKERIEQ